MSDDQQRTRDWLIRPTHSITYSYTIDAFSSSTEDFGEAMRSIILNLAGITASAVLALLPATAPATVRAATRSEASGTRVYVTESANDKVIAYDGATLKRIATIPLPSGLITGNLPLGRRLMLNHLGSRLYVLNSASLSVIDTAKDKVVGKVGLPGHPREFAISPDPQGRHIYVALLGELVVVDADPATNKYVARAPIKVGTRRLTSCTPVLPVMPLAPDPATNSVYVGGPNVWRVTQATGAVTTVLNKCTLHLALNGGSTRLYRSANGGVSVYDLTKSKPKRLGSHGGCGPFTLAPDDQYLVCYSDKTKSLYRLDAADSLKQEARAPVGGFGGRIEISPDGTRIYFTNAFSVHYNDTRESVSLGWLRVYDADHLGKTGELKLGPIRSKRVYGPQPNLFSGITVGPTPAQSM